MKNLIVIIAVVLLINLLVGGVATKYVIDFWGSYLKGVPVNVPFTPCAVIGIFFGELTVPAAICTWFISPIL